MEKRELSLTSDDFYGYMMPRWVLEIRGLSLLERNVLAYMVSFRDFRASDAYMAEAMGRSPGCVANVLSRLRSRGLVRGRKPVIPAWATSRNREPTSRNHEETSRNREPDFTKSLRESKVEKEVESKGETNGQGSPSGTLPMDKWALLVDEAADVAKGAGYPESLGAVFVTNVLKANSHGDKAERARHCLNWLNRYHPDKRKPVPAADPGSAPKWRIGENQPVPPEPDPDEYPSSFGE